VPFRTHGSSFAHLSSEWWLGPNRFQQLCRAATDLQWRGWDEFCCWDFRNAAMPTGRSGRTADDSHLPVQRDVGADLRQVYSTYSARGGYLWIQRQRADGNLSSGNDVSVATGADDESAMVVSLL
jgi:hypothetical protein